MSKSTGKNNDDPVFLHLRALQDAYGGQSVEAARIALGIPHNELERKDTFDNVYDSKLLENNE